MLQHRMIRCQVLKYSAISHQDEVQVWEGALIGSLSAVGTVIMTGKPGSPTVVSFCPSAKLQHESYSLFGT